MATKLSQDWVFNKTEDTRDSQRQYSQEVYIFQPNTAPLRADEECARRLGS